MPKKKSSKGGRPPIANPLDGVLRVRVYKRRLPIYEAAAVNSEREWSQWVRDALEAHAKRCLKGLYTPPPRP